MLYCIVRQLFILIKYSWAIIDKLLRHHRTLSPKNLNDCNLRVGSADNNILLFPFRKLNQDWTIIYIIAWLYQSPQGSRHITQQNYF